MLRVDDTGAAPAAEPMTTAGVPVPSPNAAGATVEPWLTGCWRRRSITFENGVEDHDSFVVWLQTAADYGDLRIPASRIDLSHRAGLYDCSADELAALARQQSSAGVCHLDGTRAVWRGRLRFHRHDAWPEPGDLRRVGPCLIEFAPSGAYVEDWRRLPGSDGPALALELIDERADERAVDGAARLRPGASREGLWVQSGDHAMLILDRTAAAPPGRTLAELVDGCRHDRNALAALLDLECSYAVRAGAGAPFLIERSTLPFREGRVLPAPAPQRGAWLQRDGACTRRWQPRPASARG